MNWFLGIIAGILLMGMIGDRDARNRKNFTWAFIAVIVAVVALNIN